MDCVWEEMGGWVRSVCGRDWALLVCGVRVGGGGGVWARNRWIGMECGGVGVIGDGEGELL